MYSYAEELKSKGGFTLNMYGSTDQASEGYHRATKVVARQFAHSPWSHVHNEWVRSRHPALATFAVNPPWPFQRRLQPVEAEEVKLHCIQGAIGGLLQKRAC